MTRLRRVEAWFRAHPGVWVDGLTLAKFGGAYAWRSRVSDCRLKLGMRIDNWQRRERNGVSSRYRFVQ